MDPRPIDPEHPEERTPQASDTTEELVRAAGRGEPSGFTGLYERTAPALYAWASARLAGPLRGKVEPEDVVQEVYVRAIERFEAYDTSREFRPWLFGIANRVLLELLRQSAKRAQRELRGVGGEHDPLGEQADHATAISQRVARDEALRAFVQRMQALGETERKVLVYRGLEGLPHARVATLAGVSVANAEKTWQRLRKRFCDGSLPPDLLV